MKKTIENLKNSLIFKVSCVIGAAIIAVLILVFANLKPTEQKEVASVEIKEPTIPVSIEDTDGAQVDGTEVYIQIPLNEIKADFNHDKKEDVLNIFLKGEDGDSASNVEEIIQNSGKTIKAILTDGESGNILFEKEYAMDTSLNGQLSLVKIAGEGYLLESTLSEDENSGNYSFEIYNFENNEKTIFDQYAVSFASSKEALLEEFIKTKESKCFKDVVPEFVDKIKKNNANGQLLVACNSGLESQPVYVATAEKSYSISEYYDAILATGANNSEVSISSIDNLFGQPGFKLVEGQDYFSLQYFYDNQGNLLAKTFGQTYLVDFNGDGVNELVANEEWSDGGYAAEFWIKKDGKILMGYADGLLSKIEDENGIAAVGSMYIPETRTVVIDYYSGTDDDYKNAEFDVDLSKIVFSSPSLE